MTASEFLIEMVRRGSPLSNIIVEYFRINGEYSQEYSKDIIETIRETHRRGNVRENNVSFRSKFGFDKESTIGVSEVTEVATGKTLGGLATVITLRARR